MLDIQVHCKISDLFNILGDVEVAREIVAFIEKKGGAVDLPDGSKLTSRGFQSIGLSLGFSDGFEKLHYAIEDPFLSVEGAPTLSYQFLKAMQLYHSFDTNPIYAFLHEPIYCQEKPSNWSAERGLKEFPEFNAIDTLKTNKPILFTGEMIFPFMFDDIKYLRHFSEAAKQLAKKRDWPRLYDEERLKQNTVPVGAVVYEQDMYVDKELSLATAETIARTKVWVSADLLHNGIHSDGELIINKLVELSSS